MTLFHIVQPDGFVHSEEYTGPLRFECPRFEDIARRLGFAEGIRVEHVSVLWKGKRCHMFVDENGIARRLPLNLKGCALYFNATASRAGIDFYTDLAEVPLQVPEDFVIVGPIALWEGEML